MFLQGKLMRLALVPNLSSSKGSVRVSTGRDEVVQSNSVPAVKILASGR
jgi:hypothetical protein